MTYAQWLKSYQANRDKFLADNERRFGRLLRNLRAKIIVPTAMSDSYRGHIAAATRSYTTEYHGLMDDQLTSAAEFETRGGLLAAHPYITGAIAAGLAYGLSTREASTFASTATGNLASIPPTVATEAMSATTEGITLSDRIWNLDYAADINRIVENGILNNLNPESIARQLDGFTLPDRNVETLTPYGRTLNFDSMRLARTEVIKAQGEAQQQVLANTPWVTGLTWSADGEKPCDECEGYDGETYTEATLPDFPAHPQCECNLISEVMPDEEWDSAMSDYLTSGGQDDPLGIGDWMAE